MDYNFFISLFFRYLKIETIEFFLRFEVSIFLLNDYRILLLELRNFVNFFVKYVKLLIF